MDKAYLTTIKDKKTPARKPAIAPNKAYPNTIRIRLINILEIDSVKRLKTNWLNFKRPCKIDRPLATKTYELLKTVPKGRVTTYKALAQKLGTKSYRAIGQFMKHNPYAYEACPEQSRRVPCHRVVASNGTIGGFMGKTNGSEIQKKIALLTKEGVMVDGNKVINFDNVLCEWKI